MNEDLVVNVELTEGTIEFIINSLATSESPAKQINVVCQYLMQKLNEAKEPPKEEKKKK